MALLAVACSPSAIPGLPASSRPAPPPCPNVTLIDHADEVTQFRPGGGRDLTDILIEGQIADFQGECAVGGEPSDGVTVEMELNVFFQVVRGPALRGGTGSFEYFVAIIDAQDRIMTKEIFPVAVRFDGQNQLMAQDTIYQELNLLPGDAPQDFTVIVGFQLSDEQLAYNRGR